MRLTAGPCHTQGNMLRKTLMSNYLQHKKSSSKGEVVDAAVAGKGSGITMLPPARSFPISEAHPCPGSLCGRLMQASA